MTGWIGACVRLSSKALVVPGSAERLLAAGVSLLAPQETVVSSMLEGWMVQQRSRMLAGHTIDQRRQLVRRFLAFTNDYPWQWSPADVEEWTAELVGQGLAHSTVRNYQMAVALFCAYIADPRYRWVEVCEQQFGRTRCRCSTSGTPWCIAASSRAGRGTGR